MGFFGNIAKKAANAVYNDSRKTYNNGKAYYNYKMQQAEAAQADRRKAEAAFKGYTHKGTFGTSAVEKMHLHGAEKQYRDNGYDVLKHIVTLSNGKTGIRLYVKKLTQRAHKKIATKAPARITGKGKAKKISKAKGKAFTKTMILSNKRYTLASNFHHYGDRARAYANSLKQQGFSARVKTANVNGITNYAVYTRNPTRSRKI
ncbi:hypothetical protein [Methanosarcina mazei]|uniref:Uncharacterized protein n=1 Tax=Methanosarcina mazei S-6 TaxID=213585 RepID=A0A0E3RFI6_METMZ|nr:hypothetical protein [Methanosarcina mazei]AKB64928.1 hypothetical protein MSMAS_1732 [Methanosarcina mazei S-6]